MRGKLERARAGKLPQGTGKGCYGYRYIKETGRRETDPFQAVVVQRIFQQYVDSQSFSQVSNELNEAGIPAFSGGRWYPLTIRRILMNETYTGRAVYRKTKRLKLRRNNGHGPASRVVDQPQEEWVAVEGSTPRIVDEALWQRVQEILNDPERTRRRPTPRHYALRGRLKCGLCGSAMVGQTLTVSTKPYQYYRCRHVYDKNTSRTCTARYVDRPRLEKAVWAEMKRVLTNPDIVLQELKRVASEDTHDDQGEQLEQALADLASQEKRLVDLYTVGGITAAAVREKSADLSKRRKVLEAQRASVQVTPKPSFEDVDADGLQRVCAAVADWVDQADEKDRRLALEALQVSISATKGAATMSGVLPTDTPGFITDEQSSRCSYNGDQIRS
jgi:site-specific DNA recombinase